MSVPDTGWSSHEKAQKRRFYRNLGLLGGRKRGQTRYQEPEPEDSFYEDDAEPRSESREDSISTVYGGKKAAPSPYRALKAEVRGSRYQEPEPEDTFYKEEEEEATLESKSREEFNGDAEFGSESYEESVGTKYRAKKAKPYRTLKAGEKGFRYQEPEPRESGSDYGEDSMAGDDDYDRKKKRVSYEDGEEAAQLYQEPEEEDEADSERANKETKEESSNSYADEDSDGGTADSEAEVVDDDSDAYVEEDSEDDEEPGHNFYTADENSYEEEETTGDDFNLSQSNFSSGDYDEAYGEDDGKDSPVPRDIRKEIQRELDDEMESHLDQQGSEELRRRI